jgi:hypothetical protein
VTLVVAAAAGAAPPANTNPPQVSGIARVGESLTASPGSWSGTAPLTYAYQWQSCTAYKSAVLADSPVGYWRLGESSGTTAADSSSGGNAGTYTSVTLGTTGATAGDPDTAAAFNGTSSYVSVPDSTSLRPATFSVEGWVKTTAHGANDGRLLAKPVTAGGNVSYSLRINNGRARRASTRRAARSSPRRRRS